MSKLPNAPLIEVIFRLQWHLKKEELDRYSFLPGDFYQKVKQNYQNREKLIPDGIPLPLYINKPSHKFTNEKADYPAIQIGPGILTVNTTDEFYFWDDFNNHIKEAVSSLSLIIQEFSKFDHVHLFLNYVDFIPFDFEKQSLFEYLEKYLHIGIKQSLYPNKESSDINLMLEFKTEIGWLNIEVTKGKIENNNSVGLIIETTAVSEIVSSNIEEITSWTEKAHEICSSTFKKMTEGELYQSFKKNK